MPPNGPNRTNYLTKYHNSIILRLSYTLFVIIQYINDHYKIHQPVFFKHPQNAIHTQEGLLPIERFFLSKN